MITPTNHFTCLEAALYHYNKHEGGGYDISDMEAKVKEDAIVIGPPACPAGHEVKSQKGRYYIQEKVEK